MYSKNPPRNGGMNPKHPRESPATNAAVMEGRPLSALDAARIAAEIATRKAGKIGADAGTTRYLEEKKRDSKRRKDRRLRDTRRLLRHYREIKAHAEDAITSLAEMKDEDYDFFQAFVTERNSVDVGAIVTSKARSAIMIAHIDAMLLKYQQIAYASNRLEEIRRYNVLEGMYISDSGDSAEDIAIRENINVRTVYKDLDSACARLSALLFGIQWIERDGE